MVPDSPFLRDCARKPREPGINVLNRVPIEEGGEPILSVREHCPSVRVEAPLPWLRATVCRMLHQAAESLPADLQLLVSTGMRTLDMQAAGYAAYTEHLLEQHPEWPKSTLRREANRFFHPPDAKCPPGHTTGGAVDVRLVTLDGQQLDMWSSLLDSHQKTWRTFSPYVRPDAREARAILYDAMVGAGFSNCYDEWWHYSYGDSGWAARLGRPRALYGAVPEEHYPDEMAAAVSRLRAEGKLTRLRLDRK
jgi:D-alanyl-D-alanine dipeptidase